MSRRLARVLVVVGMVVGAASVVAGKAPDGSGLPLVTVTRVTDGDTVWVKREEGGRPFKLRLLGFDAPERCQAGGAEATEALRTRVANRRLHLQARARDDYHRTLAMLYFEDGTEVGAWMVSMGHAWSYRSARSAGPYASQERQARAGRLGVFADPGAVEPWVFRRTHGPCDLPRHERKG